MVKEFEISGCVYGMSSEMTEGEFLREFLGFVEERGWSFGGGISMIVDGYYQNADGTRGRPVLEE